MPELNRREFLGAAAAAPAALTAAAGLCKAGFAERDITPAIGMEQPGGYGKAFHKTLHDACKVRAAVFDDGTRRVALAGVDALVVPRPVVVSARKRIREQCGIEENAVLIGASHSHSSGPTAMVLPGEYDHADAFVQKLAYEKSSMADAGYLRKVEDQIVDAVCGASTNRAPARTGFGSGAEGGVSFNRRVRMKNGLSYTHPGKGNPNIVGPAGPIDPEVGVIGTWDAQGALAGCVVNFACHATTSPGGISANWIYYLENTIRGVFGPQVIVVFLAGFCGDVTQVDNLSPYANPGAEQWARIVGGSVGAEAAKALLKMPAGDAAPVAAQSAIWRIPRRPPSAGHVRESLEIARREPKKNAMTEWTFAKEIVLLDAQIRKAPEVECEAQAVQVGPAVFLASPGEMFCQLGLDLKAAKVFPYTWPVELANGCVGYVPTEEAFGPRGGGYETRLTSYSNLVPNAGSQMVARSLELARRLTPGRVPEPAKAPPSTEWTYGNVPPQLS